MKKSEKSDRDEFVNSNYIPCDGGRNIYVWYQVPENEPKVMLCLVHGLGEHSERYCDMADFMTDHGIVVVGFDHRGHGRSGGRQGCVTNTRVLHNDLEQILMYARSLYPDLPLFLFGQSMGGNLVANYLIHDKSREISGAVISSAWFKLSMNLTAYLNFIGRIAGKLVPFMRLGNRIDPDQLSKDQQSVDAYRNDPLVHDRISVGLFQNLAKDGEYALEQCARIKVAVLVAHGTEDSITSFEASRQFCDNAGKNVTFHSWVGCKHEPHMDRSKGKVYKKYTEWILSHI